MRTLGSPVKEQRQTNGRNLSVTRFQQQEMCWTQEALKTEISEKITRDN